MTEDLRPAAWILSRAARDDSKVSPLFIRASTSSSPLSLHKFSKISHTAHNCSKLSYGVSSHGEGQTRLRAFCPTPTTEEIFVRFGDHLSRLTSQHKGLRDPWIGAASIVQPIWCGCCVADSMPKHVSPVACEEGRRDGRMGGGGGRVCVCVFPYKRERDQWHVLVDEGQNSDEVCVFVFSYKRERPMACAG